MVTGDLEKGFVRDVCGVDLPGCCVGRIHGLWEKFLVRVRWALGVLVELQ